MASLSLRQTGQISRTGPLMFLAVSLPDSGHLCDNPYLVTGPFIVGMLSILGDDVFQFFRQGKTVK